MVPKVSILISVYNAEEKIRDTILSLQLQTYKNFECIIIDDGSTDNTIKLLENIIDQRFKIIKSTHIGLTRALNLGLTECTGEYIARIDANDTSESKRIEIQKNFLDLNSEVVALGTDVNIIDENNKIISSVKYPKDHKNILKLYVNKLEVLPHSSLFIRRSKILEIGGYRNFFERSQDYDLILRISRIGEIASIPKILTNLRFDTNSITFSDHRLSQFKYGIMALVSYYIAKEFQVDVIKKQEKEFLEKFNNWYQFTKYESIFISRKYRSEMKYFYKHKKLYLCFKSFLNSLFYDIQWPYKKLFNEKQTIIKTWASNYFK